jgi:cytochrome c553
MRRVLFSLAFFSFFLFIVLIQINCGPKEKEMTQEEMVAHGKYLVNLGGCNDCHSPKVMTAMGPVPDTTRLLSGHPADEMIAPFDTSMVQPGKWVLASGTDFTAWVGPWGVSYTQNLTPDEETGLGAWTPELFIKALRTGKHMGVGRPILPPMPWQLIGQLKDQDLKDIFAYLHSLPAIRNKVPDPVPPNMMGQMLKKMKEK